MNNFELENPINWYPGHMKKATEEIQKNLKLVDLVVEVVDARAPFSTKNPEIDKITHQKKRIILFSKKDLALKDSYSVFEKYFQEKVQNPYYKAIALDFYNKSDIKKLEALFEKIRQEIFKKNISKGMIQRPLCIMVIGVPNVGKSTLINALSDKKSASVGRTPGVTRGKQWIKLKGRVQMLDTPGIMPPKIENSEIAIKIALLGSIKDQLLNMEELYYYLVDFLRKTDNQEFQKIYEIDYKNKTFEEVSDKIAKNRGFLTQGNELDYQRLSEAVIDEFRTGKYGKIQLDNAP